MVVKKGKQSFLAPATCNLSPATWTQWQPTARTCLCFVLRGEEILLIRKKRGIGAGKINGPGGHLEPGETPLEAAVREVQEELGITPINLKQVGELSFQFVDEATGLRKIMWENLSKQKRRSLTGFITQKFPFMKCGKMTNTGCLEC